MLLLQSCIVYHAGVWLGMGNRIMCPDKIDIGGRTSNRRFVFFHFAADFVMEVVGEAEEVTSIVVGATQGSPSRRSLHSQLMLEICLMEQSRVILRICLKTLK